MMLRRSTLGLTARIRAAAGEVGGHVLAVE
jgi:hypothetical protein